MYEYMFPFLDWIFLCWVQHLVNYRHIILFVSALLTGGIRSITAHFINYVASNMFSIIVRLSLFHPLNPDIIIGLVHPLGFSSSSICFCMNFTRTFTLAICLFQKFTFSSSLSASLVPCLVQLGGFTSLFLYVPHFSLTNGRFQSLDSSESDCHEMRVWV